MKEKQRRAALWITGAFHPLLTWGVEAIASLIPIHFHLNKLSSQHYLCAIYLPKQHMINTFLDEHHSKKAKPHHMVSIYLTSKQCLKIKSSIIDTNNHLNEVFPSSNSFNKELSPGFCLVNNFSDCFPFHLFNQKDTNIIITHWNKLNSIYKDSPTNQDTVLIISDASVKNNVAIFISHT